MIWSAAGIVGVHPDPYTLRQLCVMATAKQESDWNRTAAMMALEANINRDPNKTPPFKPEHFHPMAQKLAKATRPGLSHLKQYVQRG